MGVAAFHSSCLQQKQDLWAKYVSALQVLPLDGVKIISRNPELHLQLRMVVFILLSKTFNLLLRPIKTSHFHCSVNWSHDTVHHIR